MSRIRYDEEKRVFQANVSFFFFSQVRSNEQNNSKSFLFGQALHDAEEELAVIA